MGSSKDAFVEIGAGKPVYRHGDAAADMYLIESGQIELKGDASSAIIVLGPGDFFGLDFLLERKLRLHDAIVKENVRLLRLTRQALSQVIAENPEIAIGMVRRLLQAQRDENVAVAAPPTAATPTVPVPPPVSAAASKAAAAPRKAATEPAPAPAPSPAPVPRTPPAEPVVAKNWQLRHMATGELLPLEPGRAEFLVGRPDPSSGTQPEIDLGRFDQNRSLSRRHARILQRDGVYFVREDSGTTNGTYVNGERIATGVEVAFKPGDKLRFGTIEVELVAI